MELCEENFESLWDNSKNKTKQKQNKKKPNKQQQKNPRVLWCQFLQNIELFLKCIFMLLPALADRSEFTSNYSLQMTIDPIEKHVFAMFGLSL